MHYNIITAAEERIGASRLTMRHGRIKEAGARRAAAISLFSLLAVVDFVRTWVWTGEIPLSLLLAGRLSARIFLTFLPSLYEALCARAWLASSLRRPTRATRHFLDTCNTFGKIPCPSRGNALAIRNISEQRREGWIRRPVRFDSRRRMWLSVTLSTVGRCRVQTHRLLARMHNKNRCKLSIFFYLFVFFCRFIPWTYLSWDDTRFAFSRQIWLNTMKNIE